MPPKKDPDLASAIGSTLKTLREQRFPGHGGQLRCAKEFGVYPQVWASWEAGQKVPIDSSRVKLMEFFGITYMQLCGKEPLPGEGAHTSKETGEICRKEIKRLHKENSALKKEVERLRKELIEKTAVVNAFKETFGDLKKKKRGN